MKSKPIRMTKCQQFTINQYFTVNGKETAQALESLKPLAVEAAKGSADHPPGPHKWVSVQLVEQEIALALQRLERLPGKDTARTYLRTCPVEQAIAIQSLGEENALHKLRSTLLGVSAGD